MNWERAVPLARLERGPAVFKSGPKQIAVFKVDGRVFAVDNRCPHEGYPLAQGTVDENCLLTCNWHNWKFRLGDGRCVLGGDHVRAYPAKVEDGQVWVDTADPPPEEIERGVLDGLKSAFVDRDFGRTCREICRLHFNALDPLAAVRRAIQWSHDRFEFGTTHAYAAAADWLALAERFGDDWDKRLVCLAEAVDHMAFDAQRFPEFPYAPTGAPFERRAFLAAVEAEDRIAAEGMVRRAVDDGLHFDDLHEALAEAALDHYNDFGHSLIYVYKTGQLIGHAGCEVERFLLPALARHLCYTTREDLIPEFKSYRPTLESLPEPAAAELHAIAGSHEPLAAPFPATTREACAWLAEQLPRHSAERIYDALLAALARNLLHYDTSYDAAWDRPVGDNVGWLDFTHGVTFANAARAACDKFPKLWRPALLQMACFLGRNRSYLDEELDEAPWLVKDADAFFAGIENTTLIDHGLRVPIFPAHLVKTTLAVEEEIAPASAACRKYLLAGLNRFLHSPLKQKHVRRLARQAIDLVQRDFAAAEQP